MLQFDISQDAIKILRNLDEHLDGGVYRTFVIAEIPLVGDSTYTVHYWFNSLDLDKAASKRVALCSLFQQPLVILQDVAHFRSRTHSLLVGTDHR